MTGQIFADFSTASLPIVLLIFLGYFLKKWVVKDESTWESADTLSFKVLIPALIVGAISEAALLEISAWRILVCIAVVIAVLSALLAVLYWLTVPRWIEESAFSSVFQTSTRWNASIALVVVAAFFDASAIAIVALVMVGLMPLVNAINITVLVRMHGASGSLFAMTMLNVLKNPIIIACLTGIFISILNLELPVVVEDSLNLLGQASIAMVLLSLGAGLQIWRVQGNALEVGISTVLKLLVMPMMVYAIGWLLTIDHGTLEIMTIVTAMPTAMNGYVIAKKMGGDAPLYASCGTVQTLLSFITVPLWVLLFL